jgi:hypothetical protein
LSARLLADATSSGYSGEEHRTPIVHLGGTMPCHRLILLTIAGSLAVTSLAEAQSSAPSGVRTAPSTNRVPAGADARAGSGWTQPKLAEPVLVVGVVKFIRSQADDPFQRPTAEMSLPPLPPNTIAVPAQLPPGIPSNNGCQYRVEAAIGEPTPAQSGKCLIPISFKLTNVGAGTVAFAPVSVGQQGNWKTEQYTNLKPGESRSLVMKAWLPLGNHADFNVVADPAQAIPEQSEQNNSMVGEYSCHS